MRMADNANLGIALAQLQNIDIGLFGKRQYVRQLLQINSHRHVYALLCPCRFGKPFGEQLL